MGYFSSKRFKLEFVAATLLFPGLLWAQELTTQSVTPSTTAFSLDSSPVIDGEVLADTAWGGVTPTSGFSQVRPDEGQPATQKTEVFIGYTDDSLYIGVVAYDDDP